MKHKGQAVEEQGERPLILVVEDDFEHRTILCNELKHEFEVLEAENGQDGLEMALEAVPDLVVTDIMMPVMDGVELCRKLKTNMTTSHVPVIMLTTLASVKNQIDGYETGADDYVTKPFHVELLTVRIRNLLKSRRLLFRRYSEMFAASSPAGELQKTDFVDLAGLQNAGDGEFLCAVYGVLGRNYMDMDFSVDELVVDLGMSRRSAHRKISAFFDLTPLQLITKYRLRMAAAFLSDKSNSIADLAIRCGFGDLSHFYRLFKKEFGKSPSQYREEDF